MSLFGMAGDQWAFILAGALVLAGALFAVAARRTFHSSMGLGASLVGVAFVYMALGSPLAGVLQVLVYVGGILTLLVFAVMFVASEEEEADLEPVQREARPGPMWLNVLLGLVVFGVVVASGAFGRLGSALGADGAGDVASFLIGLVAILAVLAAVAVLWVVLHWMLFRARWRITFGIVVAVGLGGALVALVAGTPAWDTAGQGGADDIDGLVTALFEEHVVALEVLGVLLTAAMIGALVIARPLGVPEDRTHYVTVSDEQMARAQAISGPHHHFGIPAPYVAQRSAAAAGATGTPAVVGSPSGEGPADAEPQDGTGGSDKDTQASKEAAADESAGGSKDAAMDEGEGEGGSKEAAPDEEATDAPQDADEGTEGGRP